MKIVKPLTLGLLQRSYRLAGQNRLVATVLGFFPLGQPPAPRLLVEAEQWGRLIKFLPSGQALDDGMPKARGEALVLGDACAPGGHPVRELPVRLAVGGIDKRLRVVGDRRWQQALSPLVAVEPPALFSTLPLAWPQAFGGKDYEANPVGKGYQPGRLPLLTGPTQGELPNLEFADEPTGLRPAARMPGALGPMPIDWAPRKRHAGTYDARWMREDRPGLPRDVNWLLYNQAAEDQRLPGWFQGGEAYRLEGMHAEQPLIEGRLPGCRVRAFTSAVDTPGKLREFELRLDTVWFLPGLLLGIAAWRGELPVADGDALDVRSLMAAYEDADRPALPLSHYETVLGLRLDPATAALHALNESQLAPPDPVASTGTAAQDARVQARIDAARQEFEAASGLSATAAPATPDAPAADAATPATAPVALPRIEPPSPEQIAKGDFDLTPLMAQVEAAQQAAKARVAALREENAEAMALAVQAGAQAASAQPQPTAAATDWRSVLARADGSADAADVEALTLAAHAATANPTAAIAPADVPDTFAGRLPGPGPGIATSAGASGSDGSPPPASPKDIVALRGQARHASPKPVSPAVPLPADVAARLGRQVLDWIAAGVPLADRDLAGADLSGAQLEGVDFSGCLLEYANFSGARLARARFTRAVLTQATLSGADLSDADLSEANLCGSTALGASLARAVLRGARASSAHWAGVRAVDADLRSAVFDQARLEEACFDGATLESTVLNEAHLTGSRWVGAKVNRCVAWKAQAAGADFSASRWERSALIASDLTDSRWHGARLVQSQCAPADWSGASLRGLRAERTNWTGATLARTDLSDAYLGSCDLSRADMGGARLDDGCFARSVFTQARLPAASARRADFFRALLRKTDFGGADLREASFFQANLTDIRLADTRTEGLRLDPRRTLQ